MATTLSDYAVSFFDPNDYKPDNFAPIPEGKYRVRIEDVQEKISQSGKGMIELTLAVSGYSSKLWYYVIIDCASPEEKRLTNQKLGSIFDSFNIPVGNFNLQDWIGHVGGAKVRHRKIDQDGNNNNDNIRAEVHYFLTRSQVDRLPAWKEANSSNANNQDNFNSDMMGFNTELSGPIPF